MISCTLTFFSVHSDHSDVNLDPSKLAWNTALFTLYTNFVKILVNLNFDGVKLGILRIVLHCSPDSPNVLHIPNAVSNTFYGVAFN